MVFTAQNPNRAEDRSQAVWPGARSRRGWPMGWQTRGAIMLFARVSCCCDADLRARLAGVGQTSSRGDTDGRSCSRRGKSSTGPCCAGRYPARVRRTSDRREPVAANLLQLLVQPVDDRFGHGSGDLFVGAVEERASIERDGIQVAHEVLI